MSYVTLFINGIVNEKNIMKTYPKLSWSGVQKIVAFLKEIEKHPRRYELIQALGKAIEYVIKKYSNNESNYLKVLIKKSKLSFLEYILCLKYIRENPDNITLRIKNLQKIEKKRYGKLEEFYILFPILEKLFNEYNSKYIVPSVHTFHYSIIVQFTKKENHPIFEIKRSLIYENIHDTIINLCNELKKEIGCLNQFDKLEGFELNTNYHVIGCPGMIYLN